MRLWDGRYAGITDIVIFFLSVTNYYNEDEQLNEDYTNVP